MQEKMQHSTQQANDKKWTLLVIGIAVGILVTLCSIAGIAGTLFFIKNSEIRETESVELDAKVILTVDKDGCGVERSEVLGSTPVSSLTWVIVDGAGYSILERNAEEEYKYRYYQPGQYTVYINAWYDGRYHQISNEVTITCSPK